MDRNRRKLPIPLPVVQTKLLTDHVAHCEQNLVRLIGAITGLTSDCGYHHLEMVEDSVCLVLHYMHSPIVEASNEHATLWLHSAVPSRLW